MARTKGAKNNENRVKHYVYAVKIQKGREYIETTVTTTLHPDKCTITGADGKEGRLIKTFMA